MTKTIGFSYNTSRGHSAGGVLFSFRVRIIPEEPSALKARFCDRLTYEVYSIEEAYSGCEAYG